MGGNTVGGLTGNAMPGGEGADSRFGGFMDSIRQPNLPPMLLPEDMPPEQRAAMMQRGYAGPNIPAEGGIDGVGQQRPGRMWGRGNPHVPGMIDERGGMGGGQRNQQLQQLIAQILGGLRRR